MNDRTNRIKHAAESKDTLRAVLEILFFPMAMLYMEFMAKLKIFGSVFDGSFVYMLVMTLAAGFLLSFAAMLLSGRWRRLYYRIVLAVLAVWFSFHVSYYGNFHTFFSWQTLGQAKDITQFWREAIVAAENVWYVILGFFVPLVIMCAIGVLLIPDGSGRSLPFAGISLAAFAVLYLPMLLHINSTKGRTDEYTPYYYYTYLQNDLDASFRYYGIVNTTRLDIKQLLFGAPVEEIDLDDINNVPASEIKDEPYSESDRGDEEKKPQEYGWNVMDIDFEKAASSTKKSSLKKMDEYFNKIQPTRKNAYTGMFEGKNLIFITIEGFSHKVIDPEFTPTLYKMSTEGFVFKNFYNSVWGGSTASGEYSNMTGNFYQNASCLKKSGVTYQPFALGNQFSKLGYVTLAYHNNSYTYYGRDLSHPNFGYKWKAIGNGLKLKSNCWPRSDREMAEATVGDFSGLDKPFHAYYMTVSGHANYTFAGNMMSVWHRNDLTAKMKKYPGDVQAYLACQYELELMLRVLVEKLDEAGKLQDTVFAMAADHYPYALDDDGLARLYKLPKAGIRNNFELYRNAFILWSPSMKEPIEVDKPCSTIDILPTLSNLFGLEYDSRLMMGSDILAEGDHFALLKVAGWSWISTQGTYRAASQSFVPSPECTMSEKEKQEYINRMNKLIRAKKTYSKQLLDSNYYAHIFRK